MESRQEDQARLGKRAMTAGTFAGTGAVRDAHRFDEERLARWMAANVPGFEGPLRVEQFNGGQSNPTYKLITASSGKIYRERGVSFQLRCAMRCENPGPGASAFSPTANT